MSADTYSAEQFTVLKGLEPVKARPGMYTRTTCPTHLIQEVIDNAADEALAGFAKRIMVTVQADGWVEIEDDGRGIPVGIPPGETRPAVELAFTTLHAGGKFDKSDKASAYRFSGGLHGVGIAVTNALSHQVEVEVKTKGPHGGSNGVWHLAFAEGAVVEALTRVADCGPRTHGTRVRVLPNPQYFDSAAINIKELTHLLRSKAILLPGLQVTLNLPGQPPKIWQYQSGMSDYLTE